MSGERDLQAEQDYACGICGEEFRSNCAPEDIECTNCDARLCPCCGAWFSEEGMSQPAPAEPQPAPDLRALLDHETRLTWQSGLPGERARVAALRESAGLEAL